MAKKLIFVWLSITIIACSSISIYATTQTEEYTDKKITTSDISTEVASRTTKNLKAITSKAREQKKAEIKKKKTEAAAKKKAAEGQNIIKGIVSYIKDVNGNVSDGDANNMATLFVNAGKKYGIDPLYLVAIAKHESTFYPNVTSSAGCKGLMQTSDTLANKYGYSSADAYKPASSIDIGARYLSECLKTFNGNYKLGLSGYAYGCGAVKSGNFNYGYANDFTQIKNSIEAYI